jgi:hypothetical protein
VLLLVVCLDGTLQRRGSACAVVVLCKLVLLVLLLHCTHMQTYSSIYSSSAGTAACT